ncbi:MAG TPA: lipocalin-like domain-containing protein [Thermoanaerobaculia bacterium]|nr:lipocalin-like domain-containing protein [Thermoanaerobaculia bacterium]
MPKLSETLIGTWELRSRIDTDDAGVRRPEPSLGEDPVALLIYDRGGNFAAQFMRRDRSTVVDDAAASGSNNSRAIGGYDAYFGTYSVDDENGTVTQVLRGALSRENLGMTLTRGMTVIDDTLIIRLQTTVNGVAVTRELRWTRVSL